MKRKLATHLTIVVLVVCLAHSIANADGTIINGFQIEPWLTNAGDLRGVTVAPGGAFGTDPYVYSFSQHTILRVTGKETTQVFATGVGSGTGRIVFDTSGAFGNDMFVSSPIDHGGPADQIFRVTSSGNVSVFNQSFTLLAKGIAFGNGFGASLFLLDAGGQKLQRLDTMGDATPFSSNITSGSWEDDMLITTGGSFGENAYITDGFHDQLIKVSSNGVAEPWAPLQGGLSIAAGSGVFGDYLYVGTYDGNIFRVDAQGNATAFASGFGLHTPEGNFRGLAISNDVMWATSDTGTLYRITAVPEPATATLLLVGLASFGRRVRRKPCVLESQRERANH